MSSSLPATPMFNRKLTITPDASAWAGAPVLFLTACDTAYLAHATALARSLDAFSTNQHLLIHLVNPDDADLARLDVLSKSLRSLSLHVSAEDVTVPEETRRPYFASARFLRMSEILGGAGAVPVFALDSDALAVAPITFDFSDKREAEICLRRRDLKEPVEDHLRVAAGAVWAKNTLAGATFMRAVADDLIREFQHGSAAWFVDQLVLLKHVLAETGGAHVRNLKSKFSDWAMSEDSVFWTGKGDRKYLDVRYLVLREAFDEDPLRREAAGQLHARISAVVPEELRAGVGARLRRSLAHGRRPRPGIFLPRLDLPWKLAGMRSNGGPPRQSADTVELRLWWKRFAMELARILTAHNAEPRLIEIPAWEITPERVDAEDLDLAFVPHRCELDFAPTMTPRRFYMQEYFRPVFVVDRTGWSAGSSVYPVDASALPPAVLGAWDDYRAAFTEGRLTSKFGQMESTTRAALVSQGAIPEGPYIFYPLQVPHDQSIRFFSDVDQDSALDAVRDLAARLGSTLVLKEHPANRGSMRPYRERMRGSGVHWSEAHLHDVIRHADGVVTINSGAGFEALLAGKPVVCLGRAEYDAAAHRSTPEELPGVWALATAEPKDERLMRYARFVDWFLGRHAVDLSRPQAGLYVLDRIVREALEDVTVQRESS